MLGRRLRRKGPVPEGNTESSSAGLYTVPLVVFFYAAAANTFIPKCELVKVSNARLDAGIPERADAPEELVRQRRRLCCHPAGGAATC